MTRQDAGEKKDKGKKGSPMTYAQWSEGSEGKSAEADLTQIEPGLLLAVIVAISKCGGALLVGRTRDKGAIVLGVYENGERKNEIVGPNDDINAKLRTIGNFFASQAE